MATQAERMAHERPAHAEALAQRVLEATTDPAARTHALRALGIVARARSDVGAAEEFFAGAVQTAHRGGLAEEAAFSRVLLSSVYALTGRQQDALEALEVAAADLSGEGRVLATIQLAVVRNTAGDFKGGLEALDSVKNHIDELAPQRLSVYLLNRGDSLLHTHRPREAAEAFQCVVDLRRGSGDQLQLSNALHHLADAFVTAGMTAEALSCFRQIDALDLGPTDGTSWVDRASVLLAAGLLTEAEDAARRARNAAIDDPQSYWVSLAPMVHAEALEALGDLAEAAAAADEAARLFGDQGYSHLMDRAAGIALRCRARLGDANHDSMSGVADRLSQSGSVAESSALRLALARIASDEAARPHLEQVAAVPVRGVADLVASAEARARIALIDGEPQAASEIIEAAFTELTAWRAALGSTELQATTARLAVPLADLAVGEALARGDAMAVLRAAERLRLSSVISSVSPVDDPDIERLLARLRRAGSDRAHGPDADDMSRSVIESEIRELSRIRRSNAADLPDLNLDAVVDALDGHVLIEYVDHDGQLVAIVIDGSPRIVALGLEEAGLASEVESLRFAMERLASPIGSKASRETFRTVMAASVRAIERLLLDPLSIDADVPVVLVPSKLVAAVPWAAMPSLNERPVSVTPSAQLRADLARLPAGHGAVTVGVDDPASARREAEAIAELIGGNSLLGPSATVETVLGAIDGVDVAHLACHGRFRFDNPLMSSVQMSDGPLTVYDIERLRNAPRTVVMSACEVGQTARTSGEGLLGLTASLMAAGTQNVIASGTTVSDEATETFMIEFHLARLDGLSAAEALSTARTRTSDEPELSLVGASFACFGV